MKKEKTTFFGYVLAQAAKLSGVSYADVWRHAHRKRKISAEMAQRYHESLGIPLTAMRPDLWPERP